MPTTVRIECERHPDATLREKTIEILSRIVEERCGIRPTESDGSDVRIAMAVRPGMGCESFRIERPDSRSVRIVGNDDRGLLYGVGKFLRTCRFGDGELELGDWQGTSVPQMAVRGMYFATHFHNFYHDAPIDEIERYVEDLALWGCNALSVWFDMHHFVGIDDPGAQSLIDRLHAILAVAGSVGMDAGLTTIANEAYAGSPKHLRAVPTTTRSSFAPISPARWT